MIGIEPWRLVEAAGRVDVVAFWCSLVAVGVASLTCAGLIYWRGSGLLNHTPRHIGRVRHPDSHGGWSRLRDLRPLLALHAPPGRFVLGSRGPMLVVTQPETSVLVVGPTRSGKTTSLVTPNLLAWRGPAIVTSTKGDVIEATAGHRQSVGPVHVYDPTRELGAAYPSVSWSPLAGCEDLDHAWRVAAWLCAGLQPSGTRGDNDWAHWAASGKLLVAPLMHAAAISRLSVVDVRTWIQGFDLSTPSSILEDVGPAEPAQARDDARRALVMLRAIDDRPERERATVFSTVMRTFSVYNERSVEASARGSRIVAHDLLRRNGTLYLCTPRQSPERVSSLFVGLLMTVVTAAYEMAELVSAGAARS